MKKFLFLILFLGFHLCLQAQAPDTIQVNIIANDTIGACLENSFAATFNANGLHRISINPLLNFGGTTINNCNTSGVHPQLYFSLDSATTTISNMILDTSTGKWTASIDTTGICIIYYHIYIDCSVIPDSSTTSSLFFTQTWTDSLNHFFALNGNSNTSISKVVFKPYLLELNPSSYYANYLDTLRLIFMYKNTNSGTANILARFIPDSTNYCSSLPPMGFFYRIGKNDGPNPYSPGAEIPVSLSHLDTLIFEEWVIDSLCIYCDTLCTNNTCTREANFKWKCNVPPAINNIFCNDCQNNYTKSYNVLNIEQHQVKIELSPATFPNIANDKSCLNDTSFLHWEYIITNPGVSAIDSLIIDLKYINIKSLTNLTLIPANSYSVTSNCLSCVLFTDTAVRSSALCANLIPNALDSAISTLKYFHPGDTVWVSFSTFRCGEENDLELLNKPKFFNQWKLLVKGLGVCGNLADVTISPPNSHINSLNSYNGNYDLDLKLQFIPSITDLSVPADSIFGDSARFEIDMKGIVNSVLDYQLFGSSGANSKLSGWMRATIHCERGLVLMNRESEVYFQYFDVDSVKNIKIIPEFYHASIPENTCDTGNYFFYFNLEDTLMLKAINGGRFIFNLRGCCNINPAATDYEVRFHLIPNPDSCFVLTFSDTTHTQPPNCNGISCDAWIPLSSQEAGYLHIVQDV